MKIHIENIGCFKNLVDSERLLYAVEKAGLEASFGVFTQNADIAIINTCGFIGDAEEDSSALIAQYTEHKKEGRIAQLWVMGCYGQKYGDSLKEKFPEIDRVFGNFDWHNILEILEHEYNIGVHRHITTPAHYAYLKIAEGCNRTCAYCIKPILNGRHTSISMESLVEETKWLVSQGVKEIQVVSQNLTDYGIDLYGKQEIAELISRISDVPGVEWIRLHYANPTGFPRELLKVMHERENVCKYLDMALQHCNSKLLRQMRRNISKQQLIDLLNDIRDSVPGISIRTTMMVGFPGETAEMFDELCEFVRTQAFERMGVFRYSPQQGAYSERYYKDDVPEEEKTRRALLLMDIQKDRYDALNRAMIGQTQRVIVDEFNNGSYFCRTEHSTPMADPKIIVDTNMSVPIGSFQQVVVTKSLGKDAKAIM